MKTKTWKTLLWIVAAAAALTGLLSAAALAATAGSSADPLVTLSYLTETFRSAVLSDAEETITEEAAELSDTFSGKIRTFSDNLSNTETEYSAAGSAYISVNLAAGESYTVAAGGEILFLSGKATSASAALTDATTGTTLASGAALTANHLYIAMAECTVTASAGCSLLCK